MRRFSVRKVATRSVHRAPASSRRPGARVARVPTAGDPKPMTETEAHQQPAKQPHPTDPRRWSDGTVRPGAALHLTHGAYAEGPRRAQLADRLGDLAGFRAALESDHGGADTLTTIRAG